MLKLLVTAVFSAALAAPMFAQNTYNDYDSEPSENTQDYNSGEPEDTPDYSEPAQSDNAAQTQAPAAKKGKHKITKSNTTYLPDEDTGEILTDDYDSDVSTEPTVTEKKAVKSSKTVKKAKAAKKKAAKAKKTETEDTPQE